MASDLDKDLIRVNKILGKQASFGSIPANQILPWFTIFTLTYFICDGLLGWGLINVVFISLWLIFTWWLLTGKDPDNYINRFRKPRGRNWVTGGAIYVSPLYPKKTRMNIKKNKGRKYEG